MGILLLFLPSCCRGRGGQGGEQCLSLIPKLAVFTKLGPGTLGLHPVVLGLQASVVMHPFSMGAGDLNSCLLVSIGDSQCGAH